jgi:CheY-like chemotaxis protein
MEILVAEDELPIAELYRISLESKGHKVTLTSDGEAAIKEYSSRLDNATNPINIREMEERMRKWSFPFDVVVLDYRMPKKDGLEVAREILDVNPHQRIIFASAFVRETLEESIAGLKRVVELLQKPFDLDTLVDTIEDRAVYEELSRINVKISRLRELNPTHQQLVDLLKSVKALTGENTGLAIALSESTESA